MDQINNLQLDRYIASAVRDHRVPNGSIPAADSYQRYFDRSGRVVATTHQRLADHPRMAYILNMDSLHGPGNHWFCVGVDYPGRIISYVDSLGPGAYYPIPDPIQKFMKKHIDEEWDVYLNAQEYQGETVVLGGKKVPNEMCGAYACGAAVLFVDDKVPLPWGVSMLEGYFSDSANASALFRQILSRSSF